MINGHLACNTISTAARIPTLATRADGIKLHIPRICSPSLSLCRRCERLSASRSYFFACHGHDRRIHPGGARCLDRICRGRDRVTMAERPRLKHQQRSQPTWLHAEGVDSFHCPIQGDGWARFRRRRSLYSARCRRQAGFDSSVASDGCKLNMPVIPGRSPGGFDVAEPWGSHLFHSRLLGTRFRLDIPRPGVQNQRDPFVSITGLSPS
jgi:hypothetical protein